MPGEKIRGTIQNDILKEYIARGTYIYPPRPSMRLIVDTFAYCAANLPNWNTISISGYHIREAGSTAVQEIAFTLANGIAYVEAAIAAGMDVDAFAPAALLLLERPQQPLRGGGQVPGRPAHVGPHHDRALRGQGRALQDAAVPHPDRRLDAHGPAAREQHRPGHRPVPGRRPGRHPEPAHQRLRRGPGPAHDAGGQDRAAHPADRRLRVGRRRHRRPAGRLVLRRVAHRRGRGGGATTTSSASTQLGGAVAAIEARFMQDEIEAAAYSYAKAVDDGEKVVVGVNRFTDAEERADRGLPDRRRAPADPRSTARRLGPRRARPGGGRRGPGRRRRDGPGRRQPAGPDEGGAQARWPPWARCPTSCAASSASTSREADLDRSALVRPFSNSSCVLAQARATTSKCSTTGNGS